MPTLNTALLLLIAAMNMLTPILWWLTRKDMQQLEQNTNSKMDLLLVARGRAEHAAGREQGRVEGAATEAATQGRHP